MITLIVIGLVVIGALVAGLIWVIGDPEDWEGY